MEPLSALQDAEGDRIDERGDQRDLGERDDADGVDVEQARERKREHAGEREQRPCRESGDLERRSCERVGLAELAARDEARDLA